MKTQNNKISGWKTALVGLAALASSVMPLTARAEDIGQAAEKALCSTRLRAEANVKNDKYGKDTTFFKSTLGIAPCVEGKHGDEYFRVYNYTGQRNGEHLDWTAVAFQTPTLKLGDLENSAQIYGIFGDVEGVGIQSQHKYKDLTLTLNAENSFKEGKDSKRLGFQADYNLTKNLVVGAGFDRVDSAAGSFEQALGHFVLKVDDKNQVGAAYVFQSDKTGKFDRDTQRVRGFWTHFNDKWTARNTVEYAQTPSLDKKAISFDSIIAQNGTFGLGSSPWFVGRNIGDMYDLSVVEDALGPERVPLGNRTKGGLVGQVCGSLVEQAGEKSGFLRTDLGYKIVGQGFDVTPLVFYRNDFSDKGHDEKVGGSILFQKGRWCLEFTGTNSKENGADCYIGIQYQCPFGSFLKK